MLLALLFASIAFFLFVFGVMKLRMVWAQSRTKVDFGQLALVSVLLVASAGGFIRAIMELSICPP
jgi:hypothetical protein